LQDLYVETQNPFLGALIEHRNWIKLSQICQTLIDNLHPDDSKVHSSFDQTATTTGRLNSSNPNLQNVPIRTSAGAKLRKVFVPAPGYDLLVSADYSQIELRILASMSEDPALIEAFSAGEDLHTFIASLVYGVPVAEITPEMRASAKAVSYGLSYGESAYGLSSSLKIPLSDAQSLMDAYFSRFSRVKDFFAGVVDSAKRLGYTETLTGRRRYIRFLNSDNGALERAAVRMALNAPLQGTAADIIKIAMVNIQRRLDQKQLKSRILAQIHDELLLETTESEREALTEILRAEMSLALKLKIPLEVAFGFGDSWFSAAH
jgi:DNA polymerase-1